METTGLFDGDANLVITRTGAFVPFCYENSNGECQNTPSGSAIWMKYPQIKQDGDEHTDDGIPDTNRFLVFKITTSGSAKAVNWASRGEDVFEFYDDFEDGVWSDKWEVPDSSWSSWVREEDGVLKLTQGNAYGIYVVLARNVNLPQGVIDYRVQGVGSTGGSDPDYDSLVLFKYEDFDNFLYGHIEFSNPGGCPCDDPWNDCVKIGKREGGTYSSVGCFVDGNVYSANTWYSATIKFGDNIATFKIDNDIYTTTLPTTINGNRLGVGKAHNENDVYFDWIRVRKYSPVEPVILTGSSTAKISCYDWLLRGDYESECTASGYYYTCQIDPDGDVMSSVNAFNVICDMETAGGGWTLIAKFSNQDGKHWIDSKDRWTSTTTFGDATDVSAQADAKSLAWGYLKGLEFMWTDTHDPDAYMKTTGSCVGGLTASEFFSGVLANYPDTSSRNYKKKCYIEKTYTCAPHWMAEPDWNSNDVCSSNLGPNQSPPHVLFGYTDGTDTSGVISGYRDGYGEADVGLGPSEDTGFGTSGRFQDLGGPTSCSYDDNECRTEYPETVYMWIR